jgi:hypothetical protein
MKAIKICKKYISRLTGILMLITLFLYIYSGCFVSQGHVLQESEKKTFERGELRVIYGIPFLKLRGSYYEMGYQYGTLMKDKLKEIYKLFLAYKTSMGFTKELNDEYLSKACKNEIKGLSDASGVPYDDFVAYLYLNERARMGEGHSILSQTGTSILVRQGGNLLHGRNFDTVNELGKYTAVIEYNPEGKYKYFSLETIGMCGVNSGINEKGISVSVDDALYGKSQSLQINKNISKIPLPVKLKEVMDSSASLIDLDKYLEGYTPDIPELLTAADSFENNGCIYDLTTNGVKKNYLERNDRLFETNTFLNESLTERDILNNCERFSAISGYFENVQKHTIDNVIRALEDQGSGKGVNNQNTIYSTVFDLKNRDIYLAFSTGYAGWSRFLKMNMETSKIQVYKEGKNLEEEFDNAAGLKLNMSTKHFEFYCADGDKKCLNDLSNALESNYRRITGEFGQIFKSKVVVKIYPDMESFHKSSNIVEKKPLDMPGSATFCGFAYSSGHVGNIKIVSPLNCGMAQSYASMKKVIIHEYVHALTSEISGLHGTTSIPSLYSCLYEGLATYESGQFSDAASLIIGFNVHNNSIPSLKNLKDEFYDIPNGYEFASTLVEYIIKEYKMEKLIMLLKSSDNVEGILGISEQELHNKWAEFLKRNYREYY